MRPADTCVLPQASQANYLQKALSNRSRNFQIIEEDDGEARVENVVQLGPLLAIKAGGSCAAEGRTRTLVSLDDIRAEIGPIRWGQQWKILHGVGEGGGEAAKGELHSRGGCMGGACLTGVVYGWPA